MVVLKKKQAGKQVNRQTTLACVQVFRTDFFKTWYNDRHHYAVHIDTSLNDLDLHSRVQLYEKTEITGHTVSQIYQSVVMKFSILPRLFGLLKLMLHFFRANYYSRESIRFS